MQILVASRVLLQLVAYAMLALWASLAGCYTGKDVCNWCNTIRRMP